MAIDAINEKDTNWIPPVLRRSRAGRLALRAHDRGSMSNKFEDNSDHSTNKPLPWIAMAVAAAFLAIGLAIAAIIVAQMLYSQSKADKAAMVAQIQADKAEILAQSRADKAEILAQTKADKTEREQSYNNRAQVSENHWRNIETQVGILDAEVKRLNKQLDQLKQESADVNQR